MSSRIPENIWLAQSRWLTTLRARPLSQCLDPAADDVDAGWADVLEDGLSEDLAPVVIRPGVRPVSETTGPATSNYIKSDRREVKFMWVGGGGWYEWLPY